MANFRKQNRRNSGPNSKKGDQLSAKQIAVIVGLLTNALAVRSILIDSDKTVQIVLEGSLRKKTRTDLLLEELSGMSMGDFFDSVFNSKR